MIARCHIHTFRLYAVAIGMLAGLALGNHSVLAQTDPATSLKNWLEANQHESWGTWGSSYALIPYTESPSTTLSAAITSTDTTVTGADFSAFDNEGYIYVGNTVETAEIMSYTKNSSTQLTVQRGQLGTDAVAHSSDEPIIFKPEDTICETSISQLATLTAVKALLQLDPGAESESVQRAVSWIETQDFRNTEYVARQIEILSMAGRNCDAFIEKLMDWQNATDHGWGETDTYNSNAVDTVWAIRALLVAGYRNDDLISNALGALLVHSSNDPDNESTYSDSYVWSTSKPMESPWIPRKTNTVITATVYETFMEYEDYLDDLLTAINENISTITGDCEDYLCDQLTDTATNVHEKTIIAAALKRFDPDNDATLNTAIDNLITLCEDDNDGKHFLNDPYLTALILNAKAQPDSFVSVTNIRIMLNPNFFYFEASLSLDDAAWQSAKFFYKTDDSNRVVLYDSKTNTASSATISSGQLPYGLEDHDIVAAWIDNHVWAQINYSPFCIDYDLAVYDKDIKIYDNEGNIIPNNILLKGAHTSVEVRQKIHNLSGLKKLDRSICVDSTISDPSSDTVTLRPYETQVYSDVIDISSQSSGVIDVTVTVASTISLFPHSSHSQFYIIDPDCDSVNSELSAPENLQFRLLENNTILLFWEPPLDANVVGYQIGYADTDNDTVFFAATLDTSVTFRLTDIPVEFRVFSVDASSRRSSAYDALIIDSTNNPLSDQDNTPPYVAITYPDNDQIISAVRTDETDSFGSLIVSGSVLDDMFDYYGVELDDNNGTIIKGIEPDNESCVSYGVLAVFDLDNDNITSGEYTLRVTAQDLAGNNISENISITIYKWTKVLVHEGNGCSSPTVSPSSAQTDQQLIYSSYQFSSSSENDGYVSNLWHYEYDSASPVNTQLTDTYTNDMEPDWFSDNKVLFTSYRTGVRNLVIRDNESTVTERMFNVLQTTDGTYQVEYETVDLIDEDNEQVLFPKSFYNPDCATIGNKRYIVSSDELGELVLLVDNDTETNVHELTHDLQENDGKTFLLADKPSIKITGIDPDYHINVLFEGYSIEPAQDYQNEDFYINSDVYVLECAIPEPPSSEVQQLIYDDTPTQSPNNNYIPDRLFAFGPFHCPASGYTSSIDLWIEPWANTNLKVAIYTNTTVDNHDFPGDLVMVSAEKQLTQASVAWRTITFPQQELLRKNEYYWVVVNYTSTSGVYTYFSTSSTPKLFFIAHDYSTPFPNKYPSENGYSQVDLSAPMRIILDEVIPEPINPKLKQLTDSKYESETSPVWLDDNTADTFHVSLAYVSDKDCNNDGIPEWNVYFAQFDDTATQAPYLSLNTPITNAVMNDNDGIVYSLDFNNGTLAFDEEIYLPESEEFRKRIWYLKMEQ